MQQNTKGIRWRPSCSRVTTSFIFPTCLSKCYKATPATHGYLASALLTGTKLRKWSTSTQPPVFGNVPKIRKCNELCISVLHTCLWSISGLLITLFCDITLQVVSWNRVVTADILITTHSVSATCSLMCSECCTGCANIWPVVGMYSSLLIQL